VELGAVALRFIVLIFSGGLLLAFLQDAWMPLRRSQKRLLTMARKRTGSGSPYLVEPRHLRKGTLQRSSAKCVCLFRGRGRGGATAVLTCRRAAVAPSSDAGTGPEGRFGRLAASDKSQGARRKNLNSIMRAVRPLVRARMNGGIRRFWRGTSFSNTADSLVGG